MDDGSINCINSNNFSEDENKQLSQMLLTKFGIETKVKPDSKGYFCLVLNDKNTHKLFTIIQPYLHEDLFYKFPKETDFPKILNPIDYEYKPYGGSIVTSKKYVGKKTVYDFEVEDNHNFLASRSKNATKIIVHNCQDMTAVTLEIIKLINANQKLILGDKYQNIYSFMNTVNAFEELDNLNTLKLTKSFRCNPYIADIVENYGKTYLDTDFAYKGNEVIQPEDTFKVAYITRTNAMLIERMHNLLSEGQTFTLTRNVNEIFALPMALLNAATGKPVYDKRYKYLEIEYRNFNDVRSSCRNFYEYISIITEDPLLDSVTRTLMSFFNKRINIYDLKQKVQEIRKPNPNVVLTTAHAFKGLEMDSVFIEDDLNNSVNRTIQRMQELIPTVSATSMIDTRQHLSKEQKEDLNTYYVALSRAKTIITNVGHY